MCKTERNGWQIREGEGQSRRGAGGCKEDEAAGVRILHGRAQRPCFCAGPDGCGAWWISADTNRGGGGCTEPTTAPGSISQLHGSRPPPTRTVRHMVWGTRVSDGDGVVLATPMLRSER